LLRLERAFEACEGTFRQRRATQLAADRLDDYGHVGAAVGIGEHHDAALAVLAADLVRAIGLLDFGDLTRRNPARPAFDQEVAEALGGAHRVGEAHDDVETPVAIHHTRDHASTGQAAELIDHGGRLDAVERRAPVIDTDFELRNAHLLFHLKVGDAG